MYVNPRSTCRSNLLTLTQALNAGIAQSQAEEKRRKAAAKRQKANNAPDYVKQVMADYSKLDTKEKREVLQASLDMLNEYGFDLKYVNYLEIDLQIQIKVKGEMVEKALLHLPRQRFQDLKKNKTMPNKNRRPPNLCDEALAALEEYVDRL